MPFANATVGLTTYSRVIFRLLLAEDALLPRFQWGISRFVPRAQPYRHPVSIVDPCTKIFLSFCFSAGDHPFGIALPLALLEVSRLPIPS